MILLPSNRPRSRTDAGLRLLAGPYGSQMDRATLTWGYRRFYSHSSLYVVGRGVEVVSVSHCTLVEASHGECLHNRQCNCASLDRWQLLHIVIFISIKDSKFEWFWFEFAWKLYVTMPLIIFTRRDTVANYTHYHHRTYIPECAPIFGVIMCPQL
jgi:hypothetical protein